MLFYFFVCKHFATAVWERCSVDKHNLMTYIFSNTDIKIGDWQRRFGGQ